MEDNKITIRFELTSELGEHYVQESQFEVFFSLGETVPDCIGEKLNVFLKQVGYPRHNNYILMEDVNEEELEALADYLSDLRSKERAGDPK